MESHFDATLDAFQLEIIDYFILIQCTYLNIMRVYCSINMHRGLRIQGYVIGERCP